MFIFFVAVLYFSLAEGWMFWKKYLFLWQHTEKHGKCNLFLTLNLVNLSEEGYS